MNPFNTLLVGHGIHVKKYINPKILSSPPILRGFGLRLDWIYHDLFQGSCTLRVYLQITDVPFFVILLLKRYLQCQNHYDTQFYTFVL